METERIVRTNPNMRCRIWARFILVVATLSACSIEATPVPGPVPQTYFGMHIHRAVQPPSKKGAGSQFSEWPQVKFGTWRLWDAYVAWPNLEPKKSEWQFATLDKYVAMANLAGVELLLPLGLSPGWASARPNEPSSYKPGNAAEAYNLDDWRNYVRTVATRYKGRINTYQIWNEANYKHFYSGDTEKMVQMTRIAYETLKQIDPKIIVVSPSVAGEGNHTKWLNNYLAKGGGQYADVISYHFYVPKSRPEAMLPLIRDVQNIMKKHHVGHKPLWNTETGWWIKNRMKTVRVGAAGSDWLELDERLAAAYVARALILGWSAGVSRFYWYAWDNTDMGLIDATDETVKPAGLAYARMEKWMMGSVLSGCSQTRRLWTCELRDAQGRQAHIVWHEEGGDQAWSIPPAWGARESEALDGQIVKLSGGRITISLGQAPVLIR